MNVQILKMMKFLFGTVLYRGTKASNPTYGKWFKFNDTTVELVDDFESNMEQLEFECYGGNFKETMFPNSARYKKEQKQKEPTGGLLSEERCSPAVPALDDQLFGDERALDIAADIDNMMLRVLLTLPLCSTPSTPLQLHHFHYFLSFYYFLSSSKSIYCFSYYSYYLGCIYVYGERIFELNFNTSQQKFKI